MGKRRIPLSALGPGALKQIAALGVDVSKTNQASGGKYHVSPKEVRTWDGIVFASKLEMTCYRFIKERGIPFSRQSEHIIQEEFEHAGKRVAPVKYLSDFCLPLGGGASLVVDAKGVVTPVFRLKQKLLLKQGVVVCCVRSVAELAALLHARGLLNKNERREQDGQGVSPAQESVTRG